MEFAQFAQYLRNLRTVVICFALATGGLLSQTNLLLVSGTIKDDDSGRKLPGSIVVVYQDGSELQRSESENNASYSFELPLGFTYIFEYQRESFATKKMKLDFTHTPDDESVDGFGFDLDMTLFKTVDGFDTTILDTPMGVGAYNPDTKKFTFDMNHTDRMKLRIENEMNRLESIEENRSKNKRAYDVAMKAGENAMKKKKWQEALGYFNEALELMPDDEDAIVERDKAREKLDAIAAENANEDAKKSSNEAARQAEADAKAEEKARQEEEARQRQADDDARRNGNSAAEDSDEDSANEEPDSSDSDRDADRDAADAARQAQEAADTASRLAQEASTAANEAAIRAEEAAAAAKRAAVLASGENGASDDADNFFKDALKSENIARAKDIEVTKENQEELIQERDDQADVRKEGEIEELEVIIKKSEDMEDAAELRSRDNAQDVYLDKTSVDDFTAEHNSNASEVRTFNSEDIERTKELNRDLDQSVEKTPDSEYEGKAEEHLEEIKDEKSSIDSRTTSQDGALDQRRIDSDSEGYDERNEAFDKYAGEEESEAGTPKLSLEDEELPQGYYEYSYEIPNGTVKEITFRNDNEVIRYKKVLMKTGTFYFRNNKSITASIFHRETTVVHD
tara:strand:- start:622 stop:2502 length:1881 start_codon:yes stop_codon:yes gene_type:complete